MHKRGRGDGGSGPRGRPRVVEVGVMYFRTGEAALPRGFVFPGLAVRHRSAAQRETTGAPRRHPETDDEATGVDSASEVYMRSMAMFSTL